MQATVDEQVAQAVRKVTQVLHTELFRAWVLEQLRQAEVELQVRQAVRKETQTVHCELLSA